MAESIWHFLMQRGFLGVTPPQEKILDKLFGLRESLRTYELLSLDSQQKQILDTCNESLDKVENLQSRRLFSHPHLAWRLLHSVDENEILIMPTEELEARVVSVKSAFDLNVKEKRVRTVWLGDKGRLEAAVSNITSTGSDKNTLYASRYVVKEALQYLNDMVDFGFWKLSMNVMTSLFSAVLLAACMIIGFQLREFNANDLIIYAICGLIGAYISNLITKEDFLYVWGAPFWRYFLYNLVARPVTGAFSAVFAFLAVKSKLFTINVNIESNTEEWVYIVVAIAIGFAGEKALRSMMDPVLKRLERTAEKTKDTNPEKNEEDADC